MAGDFDGSSARELINALADHSKDFDKIFVDTNDLKSIHPFGKDVFQKKIASIGKHIGNINFIGENRNEFTI